MEKRGINYQQYLALLSRVDWMYDFHPDYFEQLSPEQRAVLQKGLLYDISDEEYPESIENFYEKTIASDGKLQNDMFHAVQELYRLSGSGELHLDEL